MGVIFFEKSFHTINIVTRFKVVGVIGHIMTQRWLEIGSVQMPPRSQKGTPKPTPTSIKETEEETLDVRIPTTNMWRWIAKIHSHVAPNSPRHLWKRRKASYQVLNLMMPKLLYMDYIGLAPPHQPSLVSIFLTLTKLSESNQF